MSNELANRIELEKKVIREIARRAFSRMYTIDVDTGGGEYDNEKPLTKIKDVVEHASACDMSTLIIKNEIGVRKGAILLVFGNDGWDLVCDHTDNEDIAELIPDFEPV